MINCQYHSIQSLIGWSSNKNDLRVVIIFHVMVD